MKFDRTPIPDAVLVTLTPHSDERGLFVRTFCAREFRDAGLPHEFVQSNLSVSAKAGTLRGMHFQKGEAAEDKLVRASRGRILDVIVDLRSESPAYGQHFAVELVGTAGKMLLVPKGVAHGYLTLEDDCEVVYQVSNYYQPESEGGVRWNDPAFAIPWPIRNPILSPKDAAHPDFLLRR